MTTMGSKLRFYVVVTFAALTGTPVFASDQQGPLNSPVRSQDPKTFNSK